VITSRSALVRALTGYRSAFQQEQNFVDQFLTLVNHTNAYQRHHLPGHLTGSVWIVDTTREWVLLTHHAKLNTWLQPGGHADGDENMVQVALREAEEETGLKNFKLLQESIFDIDIHPIPQRKDFPAHDHYDIRFLLQADKNEKYTVSEESHDLAWIKLTELSRWNATSSLQRMAEKVRLLGSNQ
jgi:8-oxo-dGTP pyrophosphatase MutT (NUDIX family)